MGGLTAIAAIATPAVLAYVLGSSQGTEWSVAAGDIAYRAARGTGSVGWMDQLGAVAVMCGGGFLMAIAGVAAVRLSVPEHRGLAKTALIAAMTAALLFGFLGATGVGIAPDFEGENLPGLVFVVLISVSLGTLAGSGFMGGLMRPDKPPRPKDIDDRRAGAR